MAAEQQELKLSVQLDDEATPQLARLRQEIQQLGGGHTSNVMEKFKREGEAISKMAKTLGAGISDLGVAFTAMGRAVGPIGVALGAVGAVVVASTLKLKEWSDAIVQAGNAAKTIGVNFGEFRAITDQMAKFGVSAQQANSIMAGLSQTVADLQRGPMSQVYRDLMSHATTPQQVKNMEDYIRALIEAKDAVSQLAVVQNGINSVREQALKETHSEQEAAKRVNEYLAAQHIDPALAVVGKIEKVSEEDKKRQEGILKNAQAFSSKMTEIVNKLGEMKDLLLGMTLQPMISLVEGANTIMDKILASVKQIHDWWIRMVGGNDLASQLGAGSEFFPKNVPSLPGTAGGQIAPLLGGDWAKTEMTQERNSEQLKENTDQLRQLNDNFKGGAGGLGGPGGLGGVGGAPGGMLPGNVGPGAYGPNGSDVGSGVGPGAGAADIEAMSKLGMNPMWDDKSHPATGYKDLNEAIQSHFGAPTAAWPGGASAGGGGGPLGKLSGDPGMVGTYGQYQPQGGPRRTDEFVPSGGQVGPADVPSEPGFQRQRMMAELQANPALMQKFFGISLGENKDPRGNLGVMEEMFNAAEMTGKSMSQIVRTTREGGYFAGYDPGSIGRYQDMLKKNLALVAANSNINNYAVDNSSGQLAVREGSSGKFVHQSTFGGEHFWSPADYPGITTHGMTREGYRRWRRGVAQRSGAAKAIADTQKLIAPTPSGSIVTDADRQNMDQLMNNEIQHKVQGSGKISVDVDPGAAAPKKSQDRLFKEVPQEAPRQMEPAAETIKNRWPDAA